MAFFFEDERTAQKYKVCRVGRQIWLAENFRYPVKDGCTICGCDWSNFDKFGLMYTYQAAVAACPEGWRLPNVHDFQTLFGEAVRLENGESVLDILAHEDWDGKNRFGFGIRPAGLGFDNGDTILDIGKGTAFWTSTANCEGNLVLASFYDDVAELLPMKEVTYLPVRYIMDVC